MNRTSRAWYYLIATTATIMLPFMLMAQVAKQSAPPPEKPVRHMIPTLIFVEKRACIPIPIETNLYKLPHFENAWQMIGQCDVPIQDVATAMVVFYNMWVQKFDDPDLKVWKNLNTMLIEWGEQPKRVAAAYDVGGRFIKNAQVIGLCLTKGIIWAERDQRNNIYNSSLVHELVHASLWAQIETPDADHEGHIFNGWTKEHTKFIEEVNEVLMVMDI